MLYDDYQTSSAHDLSSRSLSSLYHTSNTDSTCAYGSVSSYSNVSDNILDDIDPPSYRPQSELVGPLERSTSVQSIGNKQSKIPRIVKLSSVDRPSYKPQSIAGPSKRSSLPTSFYQESVQSVVDNKSKKRIVKPSSVNRPESVGLMRSLQRTSLPTTFYQESVQSLENKKAKKRFVKLSSVDYFYPKLPKRIPEETNSQLNSYEGSELDLGKDIRNYLDIRGPKCQSSEYGISRRPEFPLTISDKDGLQIKESRLLNLARRLVSRIRVVQCGKRSWYTATGNLS